jgi:thioredoxin-related protein
MSKKHYLIAGLVIVAGIVVSFSTISKTDGLINEPETPVQFAADGESTLRWYSVNEALALQPTTGKKIFIDVYTNWCGPCKWLDKNTFQHPVIMAQLDKYFLPVKFDAEGNDTIRFNGEVFVNPKPNAGPRMSTHQFTPYIASTPQGIAYPTMVFLNEKLEMIQPLTGAIGPKEMEPILEFIGADHYLNTSWEDFKATFKSTITP